MVAAETRPAWGRVPEDFAYRQPTRVEILAQAPTIDAVLLTIAATPGHVLPTGLVGKYINGQSRTLHQSAITMFRDSIARSAWSRNTVLEEAGLPIYIRSEREIIIHPEDLQRGNKERVWYRRFKNKKNERMFAVDHIHGVPVPLSITDLGGVMLVDKQGGLGAIFMAKDCTVGGREVVFATDRTTTVFHSQAEVDLWAEPWMERYRQLARVRLQELRWVNPSLEFLPLEDDVRIQLQIGKEICRAEGLRWFRGAGIDRHDPLWEEVDLS